MKSLGKTGERGRAGRPLPLVLPLLRPLPPPVLARLFPGSPIKESGSQAIVSIAGFHCHAIKNKIRSVSTKEANNLKRYKELVNKQPLQISGLCATSFLSYLSKRLTQIYRAQYGDAMLMPL